MSCGFYIPPFVEDFSWWIQKKCRTDNSYIDFSIIFLFSDNSKLLMEGSISICDEPDTKLTWSREFLMWCFTIFRYSDDLYSTIQKFSLESCKILSFQSAARGIIFRIKIEEGSRRFFEKWREWHRYIRLRITFHHRRWYFLLLCVSGWDWEEFYTDLEHEYRVVVLGGEESERGVVDIRSFAVCDPWVSHILLMLWYMQGYRDSSSIPTYTLLRVFFVLFSSKIYFLYILSLLQQACWSFRGFLV